MDKMNVSPRVERQKRIQFAVEMARIDGGNPTIFTQDLLDRYENGEVTVSELKEAIIEKYTKVSL